MEPGADGQRYKERRGSSRMSLRREAIVHAGAVHLLVTVRDLSASGLLVESDLLLDVGEQAVVEQALVGGGTHVRVVRHCVGPSGRKAMGLEVLWHGQDQVNRDGSGLFAFVS